MIEALAEQSVAADGDRTYCLPSTEYTAGTPSVAAGDRSSKDLSRVGVVGAELAVRRRADEQQAAARCDHTATRRVASRAEMPFSAKLATSPSGFCQRIDPLFKS